ncbi:MAG TPA: hypothetical protein VGG50_11415 [Streptosporangiaceae bacterium]
MTTDLNTITLAQGSHDGDCEDPERCLFEWYNWLARKAHTDACPPGVSWVLHRIGMRLNDRLPDAKRQQLREYLPAPGHPSPLDGTAADGLDTTRAYMAADWAIRTATPIWLDLAGLTTPATALRALDPITSPETANATYPACHQAKEIAWEARERAWSRIRAAADAAVADAVIADAVAAAAAAAAVDVADAVAVAAADAAAAVAAAAAAAVAAVADNRYSAVYKRVCEAVKGQLAPTVSQIQDSALTLYEHMVHPEI